MQDSYIHKIVVLAILLSGFYSWSQNGTYTIEFTNKAIKSDNSGIIDAYIKIENKTTDMLQGIFDAHSNTEDLYLVQRKSKPVTLLAGDSIFIPVKAIVSNTAKAGKKSTIEAAFIPDGEKEGKSAFLNVTVQRRKLAKMFLPESNLIFENKGDSLTIPIQIYNEGNIPLRITIVARYPNFIVKNALESTVVNVPAFSDTILQLKKAVTKNILNEDDFSVSITALYDNGDIIGIGTIRANSLKQNRRFIPQLTADYNSYQQKNEVTASYQYNSTNVGSYFLYANAEAQINNGILYGSIDANWWENSDQVFIRNTWLGYKEKTFGVHAGNISKFEDVSLIGRGVEGVYKISESNRIETGAIDKTFNLIDGGDNSLGESAWTTFTHNGGWLQDGYETTVVYDHDTFSGTQNYLGTSKFSIFNKENFKLRLAGALSNIFAEADNINETGGAGELLISGKTKNFFYSSSNYLSSGYFSGIRKGVTNLNERVQWAINSYNLWAVYNYLSVDPKNFGRQNFLTSQFSTTRYDIGVSRQFKAISLSLSPYFFTDKRNERLNNTLLPENYTMQAGRVSLGAAYANRPTSQNVQLTLEGGIFKTSLALNNKNHFRTNINYNWKMFNILAFYQYNYFYLNEIIANQRQDNSSTYYNLTITPTVQLQFFQDRLNARGGILYTKNSLANQIIQFNGRLDFNLSNNFSVFANSYYSDISNSAYAINSIQAGLTKRFDQIKTDRTKSNLEVYVYYEITGKGPLDKQNIPAANQLIIIDNKAFKTNSNGIVKYRGLPAGDYEIKPMSNSEWHAYSRKITVTEDTKVAIGMDKTITIKGNISYFSTETSYQITKRVAGLSILLIDDFGNIFNTKTDDSGNFIMYVPKGNYTITLEKSGISEYVEVEGNNQQVKAVPNEINTVKFILNIREKRIETRKFTSKGFPSMSKEKKK